MLLRLCLAPMGQRQGALKPGGTRHRAAAPVCGKERRQGKFSVPPVSALFFPVAVWRYKEKHRSACSGFPAGIAPVWRHSHAAAVAGAPPFDLPVTAGRSRRRHLCPGRFAPSPPVAGEKHGQLRLSVPPPSLLHRLVGGGVGSVLHLTAVAAFFVGLPDPTPQHREQGQHQRQYQCHNPDDHPDGVFLIGRPIHRRR